MPIAPCGEHRKRHGVMGVGLGARLRPAPDAGMGSVAKVRTDGMGTGMPEGRWGGAAGWAAPLVGNQNQPTMPEARPMFISVMSFSLSAVTAPVCLDLALPDSV